ncbi:hypothetical protein HDU93_003151, partial [Gonapodya sp. JEL0774]
MADEVSEDAIVQFCEMAGCDPDVAASYLKVSNGDLERALGLFFETGGAPLDGPAPSTMEVPPQLIPEDDNPYSALTNGGRDDESGVRAPIARTMDTLVGGDGPLYGMPMPLMGLGRGRGSGNARPGAYPTIGDDRATNEAFRDFSREAEAQGDSRNRLADLFKPPLDIMFAGDFDSGRILAQQRAKWILVNIQDPTEFQCQVLNRDLWSNSAVKDAIKEHFLFMQFGSRSQEGQKYVNLYKAYRYPHVAIIDPRTGEKAAELKRLSEPVDFIEERELSPCKNGNRGTAYKMGWFFAVYDFTDRNSLTDFKNKKAKTEPKV